MNEFKIGDLKIKYPIIQGGMGVAISLSGLASAVANQGGIGVISAVGIGMTEPDYLKNFKEANKTALKKEISKARCLTDGVLGVNIMLAVTDAEDLINIAIEENIDVVFLGAGLPLKMPDKILEKGFENIKTKFIPKVSSAKAIRVILKYWAEKYKYVPDAFAVEGPLAGGHLGFKKSDLVNPDIKLSTIIRESVQEVQPYIEYFGKDIPIIAAGGIYTGKDIYEIFQSGAKAVKMGTRFVTTYECDAALEFKESYINSKKEDITIIDSPVGLPGRVIKNEFVNQINRGEEKPFKCSWQCLKTCNFRNVQYCIAKTLFNSANGKMHEGFAFAGSNAYKATKLQSVKEIFDELIAEFELTKLAALYPVTNELAIASA
jgi:NAD(P)H-dependent flavin oxidoreductase YrpB (nitropropane dioxygenase family)